MNWTKRTMRGAVLALALGGLVPTLAGAQTRVPPQRTRITNEDRKAAAEARKAVTGASQGKPATAPAGTTVPVQAKGGAK